MRHIPFATAMLLVGLSGPGHATDFGQAKCPAFMAFMLSPEVIAPDAQIYFSGMLKGAGMASNERSVAESVGKICITDPTTSVAAAFSRAMREAK